MQELFIARCIHLHLPYATRKVGLIELSQQQNTLAPRTPSPTLKALMPDFASANSSPAHSLS